MTAIPKATTKRLIATVPKFKKVLESARTRDVNESDTVTIVTDILDEVFGFDKYSDITREYAINGTYCDLAIKADNKIQYLIEVKAIGRSLRSNHVRQLVTYAARDGVKWVVLTNGVTWAIYRVTLEEKIESTKLVDFNFTALNAQSKNDQELLFLLCKRGVKKEMIEEFYKYRQAVNSYSIGAVILSKPVISAIRRELRGMKAGLKVSEENIKELVETEVLKRELVESDEAAEAHKMVKAASSKRRSTTRSTKKLVATKAQADVVGEVQADVVGAVPVDDEPLW